MTNQFCYVHIRGQKPGNRIGIVHYLDSGYYPTNLDSSKLTEKQVEETINFSNGKLDITPDVRLAMEIGSMFGWRVPGAQEALEFFGKPDLEPTIQEAL